jgi:hypothetical protein
MRIVIVVLIVIAVAFIFVAVQGGLRGSNDSSASGAPPTKDGKIDEDALSGWKPPSMAKLLADLSEPFAPSLNLTEPKVVLPAGGTATRGFPAYYPRFGRDMRVARIELQAGAGIRISYACLSRDDRRCPETACLCAPGATFTAMQISACPDAWQSKRLGGVRCTKDDASTNLVIYPEPGALAFTALGQLGATAEVK